MKHVFIIPALLVLTATAAQAACYADYKAKQDNPLRLQYGVAEVRGECTQTQAEAELAGRLASGGWQLLEVLGVFDETGLDERQESAGDFYLRY